MLLKRRERLDFHRYGIPSNFSFPKLLFIESHTIISEVCFNNREFHSLILVPFLVSFLLSWVFIASLLNSWKSPVRVYFFVSFLVSYSLFLVSSFASWVSFLCLEYHFLPLECHSEFSVHFSVYFIEFLSTFSVYIFAIMSTIFII